MFRSPRFFSVSDLPTTIDLNEVLSKRQHRPPSGASSQSMGFVSPFGPVSSLMTHEIKPHASFTFAFEKKLIPPSLLKKKVLARVAEIVKEEGREPKKKEIKEIKDSIKCQLVKDALTKITYTPCLINTDTGLLVIDSSSASHAKKVVEYIIDTIKGITVDPLSSSDVSPEAVLTTWIKSTPENTALGNDCTLLTTDETKGRIACSKIDDIDSEVETHISSGKQVISLSVIWKDAYSMTINSDLSIKKFRINDTNAKIETLEDLDAQLAEFAPIMDSLNSQLSEWFS